MFLNAIRFRTEPKEDFSVWKFNQGRGKFSNLLCFHGQPKSLSLMHAAIKYAVSGQEHPGIHEVAIQIADDSGDTWVIERAAAKLRYLRNGAAVESADITKTLLSALLDMESVADFETATVHQLMQDFTLEYDKEGYIAKSMAGKNQGLNKIKRTADNKSQEILASLVKKLDRTELNEPEKVAELLRRCEPLYFTNAELLKQRRQLLANARSLDDVDLSLIGRLQNEVDLLNDIEKAAAPLVEPGSNPKFLKEKITKIESQLQQELRSCKLTSVPLSDEPIPWTKLADARCKLEACEKLIASSEGSLTFNKEKLAEVHANYIETVEKLISNDTQMTAELESCLSTLNIQMSSLRNKPKKKGLSESFSSFIRPSAGVPEPTQDYEGQLESSRMAVDFALARLGELHASVATANQDFEDWQLKLGESHESLMAQYGKARDHWAKLASAAQIPEETSLKELMRIMGRYSHLAELWNQKHHYRRMYSERQAQLEKLDTLLREYRQSTSSQKDVALSTQSLLIAEAQGILRYKAKKESQLKRMQDVSEHIRAYNVLKVNISNREQQLQKEWRKIFQDLSLELIEPAHAGWKEFFRLAKQQLTWQTIAEESENPLRGKDIFCADTTVAPLNTFLAKENNLPNKMRLNLLSLLEGQDSTNLTLLLVADPILAEMLVKMGSGRGRPVEKSQKRQSGAAGGKQTKATEQASSRADAVMEILKTRVPATSK